MHEDTASADNRGDFSDKNSDSVKNLDKYKKKQHSVRPQFSNNDQSSEDYSPVHKHIMIDSANVS